LLGGPADGLPPEELVLLPLGCLTLLGNPPNTVTSLSLPRGRGRRARRLGPEGLERARVGK
jgi:hypothetical protein